VQASTTRVRSSEHSLSTRYALGDDPEVVEAVGALDGHAVLGTQQHLGGDAPDGSGDRRGKDVVQHGDGRRSGHDEEGSATDVLHLTPPNLDSAAHQVVESEEKLLRKSNRDLF